MKHKLHGKAWRNENVVFLFPIRSLSPFVTSPSFASYYLIRKTLHFILFFTRRRHFSQTLRTSTTIQVFERFENSWRGQSNLQLFNRKKISKPEPVQIISVLIAQFRKHAESHFKETSPQLLIMLCSKNENRRKRYTTCTSNAELQLKGKI